MFSLPQGLPPINEKILHCLLHLGVRGDYGRTV